MVTLICIALIVAPKVLLRNMHQTNKNRHINEKLHSVTSLYVTLDYDYASSRLPKLNSFVPNVLVIVTFLYTTLAC